MKKKLKELFGRLGPSHKRLLVAGVVVAAVVAAAMFGYMRRASHRTTVSAAREKTGKITLDTRVLEKAFSSDVRRELKKRDEEMEKMKTLLREMEEKLKKTKKDETGREKTEKTVEKRPSVRRSAKKVSGGSGSSGSSRKFPFPPPPSRGDARGYRTRAGADAGRVTKPQSVGGIEVVSETGRDKRTAGKSASAKTGKKKDRSIYLPPSFMEATLLTGFSAATMQSAKTYEKPALLRVKDMAVLPNELKADLKGCFILASAHGDLADERAHVRLVSLSCITRNGQSVVDAPVKGFVVDSDGKIGLSGNVVTKAGALLGRSLMAGFFGGVGDAMRAATTTTSISSLGTTQTIDTGKIVEAGIGGGISEGFGQLQDFYLEMAKQTFPVIEVGATKKVTVVIEEGVNLDIKDYCIGGFERCSERTEEE